MGIIHVHTQELTYLNVLEKFKKIQRFENSLKMVVGMIMMMMMMMMILMNCF